MPNLITRLMFVCCAAFLTSCQSNPLYGSGPLQLSNSSRANFEKYKKYEAPLFFVISEDGRSSYAMHCPHGIGRCEENPYPTIYKCQSRSGKKCKIFAEYKTIVWKDYEHKASNKVNVVVQEFGSSSLFSTTIANPLPFGDFTIKIAKTKSCSGEYRADGGLHITLKCDDEKYQGSSNSFTWKEGGSLELRGHGKVFELMILPYTN